MIYVPYPVHFHTTFGQPLPTNMSDPSDQFLRSVDPDDNFFDGIFASLGQSRQSDYYCIDKFNNKFSSSSCLTIFNLNIRSYNANIDKFIAVMESLSQQPEIIIITETWLSDDAGPSIMEGYQAFHTVRSNGKGGGVSVFCKRDLPVDKIEYLCNCSPTIESCVVKIRLNAEILYIIAIYRPHSDTIENFTSQLDSMLQNSLFSGNKVFLAGDLNIDLLSDNCRHVSGFVSSMQSLHFLPLITKPTRFPPNDQSCNPSLLDHIWSNSLCNYSSGILALDITDHCPTFVQIPIPVNLNEKIKLVFRSHSSVNVKQFINALSRLQFNFDDPVEVSSQTENFIQTVNTLYCSCFPLKIKFVKSERLQKPWLTSDILKLTKTKA
jgi:hypothetical protein